MKRYAAASGWALGMLMLILDGQTALSGAASGLDICVRTLIPSLFPFFVLSSMLAGALPGHGLLLAGILAGYPVGAANAAAAYRAGQLEKQDAERMAVLCCCAGPSFLFGVTGPVLGGPGKAALLWGVYLCSVLSLWIALPKCRRISGTVRPVRLQQALNASLRAMAGVCGWVILFRVLLTVLDRWVLWLLPQLGRVIVYGVLELSNGCLALEAVAPGLRFVLAAGMVSFGGVCVMLQTAGVTEELSLKLYFPGKIYQASVSMLLASLLVPGTLPLAVQAGLALTGVFSGMILRKSENRCGNRCPVGV